MLTPLGIVGATWEQCPRGIDVVGGDEVNIEERWEDVFDVVEDTTWKWGPRIVFKQKDVEKA